MRETESQVRLGLETQEECDPWTGTWVDLEWQKDLLEYLEGQEVLACLRCACLICVCV